MTAAIEQGGLLGQIDDPELAQAVAKIIVEFGPQVTLARALGHLDDELNLVDVRLERGAELVHGNIGFRFAVARQDDWRLARRALPSQFPKEQSC